MSKILVVCIDGTWNAPGQLDKDPSDGKEKKVQTNVAKTWEALSNDKLDANRPYGSICKLHFNAGEALYLNGVGSSGTLAWRRWQGSTGTGTSERILHAYRFLAERWQPGDRIFGFGFSRGAFAVRSLAGLINAVGLPVSNNLLTEEDLTALLKLYRDRSHRPAWTVEARVEFLGLWDTVSALAFGRFNDDYHEISPHNVEHVCHALAIDEARKSFQPELWENKAPKDQKVKEVWFIGAHSNVGGSYSDANLSNIAFFWVLKDAVNLGLRINLRGLPEWMSEDIRGAVRPSYHEYLGKFGPVGRWIKNLGLRKGVRRVPSDHLVHESVIEAMNCEKDYNPLAQNVKGSAVEPWGFPT